VSETLPTVTLGFLYEADNQSRRSWSM